MTEVLIAQDFYRVVLGFLLFTYYLFIKLFIMSKRDKKILSFVKENTHMEKRKGVDFGWGNGYIVVFDDHVSYGAHYDSIGALVHGGLTFSKSVNEVKWSEITDEMKDGWIFGFDTMHLGDTLEKWPKEKVEEETKCLKEAIESLLVCDMYADEELEE